jgi:hypothetical protein
MRSQKNFPQALELGKKEKTVVSAAGSTNDFHKTPTQKK